MIHEFKKKKTIFISFCYLLSICHYYFLNSRLEILIVCLLCIMRYKFLFENCRKMSTVVTYIIMSNILITLSMPRWILFFQDLAIFIFTLQKYLHLSVRWALWLDCERDLVSLSIIYFCSDPVFCTTILASATICSLHLNDLFFHCIRVWITRKSS